MIKTFLKEKFLKKKKLEGLLERIFDRIIKRTAWIKLHFLLKKIYWKDWKMQSRPKKIITLRTIWVKSCCLRFNFLNAFEIGNSMSLWWTLIKTLYGQYRSNRIARIVSWSEFVSNIVKFNIYRSTCVFDKGWSFF